MTHFVGIRKISFGGFGEPRENKKKLGARAPRTAGSRHTKFIEMEILFIGGVADGETFDLPGNAMKSRHSFKLSGDFPSDLLRHHDYERQVFVVRRRHAVEDAEETYMVWNELPRSVVDDLVQARAGAKVVSKVI